MRKTFPSGVFVKRGIYWIFAGVLHKSHYYHYYSLEKELYILSVGIGTFGLVQINQGYLSQEEDKKRTGGCIE
jgi:hypothetical protein